MIYLLKTQTNRRFDNRGVEMTKNPLRFAGDKFFIERWRLERLNCRFPR